MITDSSFRPAWWCRNRHLQTLYPSLLRRRVTPPLQRQRLDLPDGDFIDIDWTALPGEKCVLVLHGLEGSLESHYSGGLLKHLASHGYRAGLMYFRGCSGEPNRLARSYHSGETGDLDFVIRHLHVQQPGLSLAVIGFSLGGNVLLKWLGERGADAPVSTAIAISVPFDLDSAAQQLQRGLSRIYRNHLLARLRQSVVVKSAIHPSPVALQRLRTLRSFHAFDNAITAPLHGFRDVDDYYQHSSSKQFLKHIKVPTLILQARDDPFLPGRALPGADELSEQVTLELAQRGGHVGFVAGSHPCRPVYWLEQRISTHLDSYSPSTHL
jgi:predicted alpha/beta-fold hydrolase